MRSYHHEQTGPIYVVLVGLAAFLIAMGLLFHAAVPSGFVGILLLATAIAFGRLIIDVDDRAVRWSMTFGWPCGTIPFDQIVHVQIVPVNFWMGIGIHLTFRGWVWNVSLGRGVQIMRPNGIAIVLGTDDPDALIEAISRAKAA